MDGNIIGNKIKELRIAKNVTQEELASRVNVAKATISAYENGSRLPSYTVLVKLSRIFHVSTDNLLGVDSRYSLDVTALTPHQRSTIQEIIAAYVAYNNQEESS